MLLRRAFVLGGLHVAVKGQGRVAGMFADAEAYERFMGRWSRLVAPQLVEFAALPEGGRFLDVGSGTGSLAFAIGERYPQAHILGIDPSKEYVAYASSKNPFSDRAKFEIGDAQRLSFGDSSFDAAVSLLVFNFIPDPGRALSEVRRVTKPGGSVSAAVWDYGAGMRMLRVFWDAVVAIDPAAEKLDEKRMPLCRAGELSELWRQGGLETVLERAIDIHMRFASFADYWEPFLLGQGPAGAYTHGLLARQLTALRGEIKRRLGISAEDRPIELPARVWAVRGVVPSRR
jgi:ubiquinone/menaquinone biosynthesis C-methylase UbiE